MLAWLLAVATAGLAGCDRGQPDAGQGTDADATAVGALPEPEAGAGSVTGMPPAGDADATTTPAAAPADAAAAEAASTDAEADATAPAPTPAPTPAPAPAEPVAEDAAAVVRTYYGAIDAGEYERAYGLWSGGGHSSGQSASEFAAGFDAIAGVSVQTGAPGRVEGAAGSRYVRVPVTIQAQQDDGSVRRYQGTYTLRRSVVDGATAAQRDWRIESADLREVP